MDDPAITYVDEEDCLGFKIWVAELELIVGGSRGARKPDADQVFLLLQKLVATLDRTDRTEVREYQRRCEDALIDILLKGAPPPVRRLVCEALGKLYSRGDQIPLFSRVSSLQLFLGTKEAAGRETSEDIRLGALELMSSLYYSQGRALSIGVMETTATAVKYCARGGTDATRFAALRLLAAAVEGVGGGHRNAAAVQNEAIRALERLVREKDAGVAVRVGVADALRAVAACGGAQLWAHSLSHYEFARSACLAGIQDPEPAVRAAYARAMGEIVTAAASDDARASIEAAGKKPRHQEAQRKALASVIDQCLVTPFAEAAVSSDRAACTALAQAWVFHLAAARLACGPDEPAFIEPALKPLEALRAACALAGNGYPEKGPAGGDGELGLGIGGGERPHAQACILYVMRAGVIEQLGEAGQRLLLERVATLLTGTDPALAAAPAFTPLFIVALEMAALLAEALGEVGPEAAQGLETAIASKLVGPHAALRLQAASALAALAVAEPARAGKLLGTALASLRSAADAVVEAASATSDKSKPLPGTPRGPGSGKIKAEMNALHGWSLGSAALVAAASRLPLGVPSHYIRVAGQLAAALVEAPRTQMAAATCLEREAGYIMLGVLCAVVPAASAGAGLGLWTPALGADATTALEGAFKSRDSYADYTLAAELWWRTAALQTLAAFVRSHTAPEDALITEILGLLRPLLALMGSQTALRHPVQARGGPASPLAAAAAMTQLRLLQVYSTLPPASIVASGDAEGISALCIDALRTYAAGLSNTGALAHLTPALQAALDPADGDIGPWGGGRDPLERALLLFQGAVGGPPSAPWDIGLRTGVGYAVEAQQQQSGAQDTSNMYPQPLALAPALLAAQSALLGAVLRAAPVGGKVAILDALLGVANTFSVGGKKEKDAPRRVVAVLTAVAPVLAGLGGAIGGALAPAPDAAGKVLALAEAATAESAAGVLPQRAAAGLYAAAARLSGDAPAVALVKQLCTEAAQTASLPQRAAQALAVGATSRAIGGLGLAAVLPLAADTLAALATASDASIAPVVLHGLMSCSQAAGLSFVPHVRSTLALLRHMLLSQAIYSQPGLLPAVGRLANAMVAALGPDYVLGSAAYDACRSVVAELRAPDASGVRRPEDSLAASLQSVLYAQMLVLFAPRALPAAQHVAVLVGTLPSRQPQLRKAAADTLRHLAEKDGEAVAAEQIEPALLAALDGETDPATAAQLQETLSTLCEAGAAAQPSRWIALCGEIIAAAGPAELAAAKSGSGGDAGLAGSGDSDGEEGGSGTAAAPPLPASQPATPSRLAAQQQQAALTPRLRTRTFAARCLLRLPGMAVAADPRHSDLAAAQAAASEGDWLVLRLQSLVDLGFKMATGPMVTLRALGVDLMLAVLTHLGDTPDPLAEGVVDAKLLAQYQAQYVSTLRASLAPEASPEVGASGAALAAAFLEKGLAAGDAVVMERMMGLLCAPLAGWASGGADPAQAAYSEWVAARARVALLESHAHCAAIVAAGEDPGAREIVVRTQGPHLTLLVECWTGLLHDFAVLRAGISGEAAAGYKLSLYGRGSAGSRAPSAAAVGSKVGPALQRAWPVALEAASYSLVHDRTVSYGPAGKERHNALLDLTVAAALDWAVAEEDQGELLVAPLRALQRLTAARFAKEGWLSAGAAAEAAAVAAAALRRRASLPLGALEAAAAVLEQLSAVLPAGDEAEGAEESLLAGVDDCVAAAAAAGSVPALTAALAALTHRVAAADDATHPQMLHRSLAEGLRVMSGEQACADTAATAAAAHIVSAAKTAALRGLSAGIGSSDGPTVDAVLTAAAATAAQQAQRAVAARNAALTRANLSSALALGAFAIAAEPEHAHTNGNSAANGAEEDDEWGDTEFASAGPSLTQASPSQALVLDALSTVIASEDPAVALSGAQALSEYLQTPPPPLWAAHCAAAALPPALAALHALLQRGTVITDPTELQFAVEILKCGLLVCNAGGDAGAAALTVVVPCMVEAAAPPGQPTPELAEAAVKLLMGLASGPSAAAFKATVAALPEGTRARLQRALASVATAAAAPGPGQVRLGASAQRLPTIQLKKFGA